jgi:nucleoside-diphosphate kinase
MISLGNNYIYLIQEKTGSDFMEKTFIMIKSDGVRRGLVGEIIGRIERKGFKIIRARLFQSSRELVEEHYMEHKGKVFFNELIEYILEGPVMAMEVEGESAVETMRLMIGNKDPKLAAPGTIRGDFANSITQNIIHGSDSAISAERELNLWFD